MSPQGPGNSPATAPLPPLPSPNKAPTGQGGDPMAAVMAGIAPVKSAVDQIMMGCKAIVQSQAIPGSEQVCSQIMALATSLLPMAVQSAMMPQGPGGPPSGTIGPLGA